MKTASRRAWLTALLIMAIVFVSACSGGAGNGGEGATDPEPAAETNENAEETASTDSGTGEEPAAAGPLGKYDPPVEVTSVRIVNDTFKYAEGEDIDNNIWSRTIMDKLGIDIQYDWVVSGDGPGGQGEQKMNVSIASGDLPEIIPVSARQLKQLVEGDLLMDLTDIYEQYASPFTKEIMNQDGPNALASATFDGKLMAIPNTGSAMDGAFMVWVRTDWLKKLNLPEPQTMDDVLKISEAFTTQDPDGNGKADTIGLSLNKDLYGGYAGIDGFLNGFHAYPRQWVKDSSGKLVFGSIQPEMKVALAKLQELNKKGQIDREFGVKDQGKAAESAAAGKAGLHFGQMWNPLWPLVDNKRNDPNAEWQAYPLVSVDDKPAQSRVNLAVGTYYAVLKEAKHPEALLKIINLFVETGWGESTTPENYAEHFTKDGFEKHKYTPFQTWPARKNLDIHLHISEAMDSGDESKLNPEEQNNYAQIKDFLEGKAGSEIGWAYNRVFGKEGSFKTIDKYVDEGLILQNEFFGAPTDTMVEKDATLLKMELEVFSKIILGDPIDHFDKFVEDWKKLGGDDITEEVNEWYASK
ncbi:extracellular solute-binding protein [Paenibacillus arenilitoris]|uniref:Extracellular solute-binding protein n=1 Tax=Paenibacillus arenilitoris TaxID=2772299 RepID=A0A927CNR6_9BACL|nr:extracellular solute-binding protein [Paenibacillus arenilitoris]MBD2868960.1 extracellular solute-binding protein [Paenibacillus arenilitoris]